MKPEITFYTNPMSRGRIVRWMLEEVGAQYETCVINYGPEMKAASYLAINPMGKVPALSYHGKVVAECAAICAYLADQFPKAKLAPALAERHDYYRWLFFGAGPVEAAVTNKSFGFEVPPERQAVAGYGSLELVVDTLAKAVAARPFLTGDSFSAADVYVGSQIVWGLEFKTMPARPEFQSYVERICSRDAFRRAKQLDDELLKAQEKASS